MALDPSIYNPILNMPQWGAQLGNSVNQGFQLGQAIQQAPMRNRLLEAQTQGTELSNQAAQQGLDMNTQKMQIQDLAMDWAKIKPALESGDMQRANVLIAERINKIQERGGDPSDTIQFRDQLNSGQFEPMALSQELDASLDEARGMGWLGPQGGTGDIPTAIQNRTDILNRLPTDENGRLLPVKQMTAEQQAIAVEAGLVPRAGVVSSTQREATDPNLGAAVTDYEAGKEGAKEAAKLAKQFDLKPSIAAAVEQAVIDVRTQSDIAKEDRTNTKALNVYDTAMSNLVTSLGGTTTGPGAGWLPALTSDAQAAEGAMAVMTPVLKSIFRTAGEGTFTDKDQELLEKMVPTRSDLPEARAAKVAAIDAIVRAKLGSSAQGSPKEPQPADQPPGNTFTSSTGIQFTVE